LTAGQHDAPETAEVGDILKTLLPKEMPQYYKSDQYPTVCNKFSACGNHWTGGSPARRFHYKNAMSLKTSLTVKRCDVFSPLK
jgi:hypothetical protein